MESKEKALALAKQQAAECAAAGASAEENYATTTEALEAASKLLFESKTDCARSADEWKARKASAEEEITVLGSAIEILGGKFGAFIQIKHKKANGYDPREEAAALLRQLGRKFNQFQLMQAAASAEADPFEKVRKMVSEMISKLEEQSVAEASKEEKCSADIKEGKAQVKVKGQQMKELQARGDFASASFTQLGTEISDLSDEVKNLEAMRQTWTKERTASKAENESAIKEAEESVEALNSAIGTLKDFYAGAASLLQNSAKGKLHLQKSHAFLAEKIATSVKQPKMDKADAIIQMLITAQSDFEKIRQETEAAERDSQKSFETQQQDAEVSLAKKNALIEGKTKERAAFKLQKLQIDEDLEAATEAFVAAGEYLKSRQESCANKVMTFEERQAARTQEIEGLRTALNILSGEEGAALVQRQSLLKKKSAFGRLVAIRL